MQANRPGFCYPRSAMRRWRWAGPWVLLVVAAWVPVAGAQQAAPTGVTGSTGAATQAAPKPFPVADIAAEAQATVARLRTFEERAQPLGTVASVEAQLPELERRVSLGIEETEQVLKSRLSLASLDALVEPWADVREQARAWVAALTQRWEPDFELTELFRELG